MISRKVALLRFAAVSDNNRIRRRAIYRGRVQGVGFRATVTSIARRNPVSGFVRNLSDGTVELVADAAPTDLDRFLAEIHEAMSGYISTVSIEDVLASEAFHGFHVRY